MPNLSDYIEEYLIRLLRETAQGMVELQRNELAERFRCAPSQINYVLATRFTPERGYVLESRRGGGGYIRIIRLSLTPGEASNLITREIDEIMSQEKAEGYIRRFLEEGIITEREAALVRAATSREAIPLELPMRDVVRASLFKAMVLALLSQGKATGPEGEVL